jgi:hypothetical protein
MLTIDSLYDLLQQLAASIEVHRQLLPGKFLLIK